MSPMPRECRQIGYPKCDSFVSVIPAKAGIQNGGMGIPARAVKDAWIPAFAGMTGQFDDAP